MLSAVVIFAFSSLLGFGQQASGDFLSVDVSEEEWGIRDWSSIKLGQLSVVHESAGDKLLAQVISDSAAPAVPKSLRSSTPSCDGNCFVVSTFEEGSRNRLDGYYSAFSLAPSTARLALSRWEDGNRTLTLDFNRAGAGYCGMWIHLFDFRLQVADRTYMNIGNYSYVAFWIRGKLGNERILLKISDAQWEQKEDSLPIGELGSFLPRGRIESTWQQAVVPLTALPRDLNIRQLASLVFEPISGEGSIAIKDLAFCVRPKPLPALSFSADSKKMDPNICKALWVWNTDAILPSATEQAALVDFCSRQAVTHVYLQLPKEEKAGPGGKVLPLDDRWKSFLALLSHRGIRAYALDGFRDYALPEWHERVLETVRKIVEYNRKASLEERFAGIHYDIEPYLIPGFQGPRRWQILSAYLELLEKMSVQTRSAGMHLGADIPFWYDATDSWTGLNFVIQFHGKLKPISEHIIDLLDSVTIMDYRTFAFGADGIAAQAEGELAYAAKTGKKVFVGLETTKLPDEHLIYFEGKPVQGLPEHAPSEQAAILEPTTGGVRIWLVTSRQWDDFYSAACEGGAQPGAFLLWPIARNVAVPSNKLTFAGLGATILQQTLKEVRDELTRWTSFAGFAIHDYMGFRSLLESASTAGK